MSAERRRALYRGEVVRVAASAQSRALAELLVARAERAFSGALPLSTVHERLSPAALFERVTALRGEIAADAQVREAVRAALVAAGIDPAEHAVDTPRLRVVPSGGHRVAAAAPAYHAHRDTWYANPRAQINVWTPLLDARAEETFVIHTGAFGCAVPNDSASFDYAAWRAGVGFQNPRPAPDAPYPRLLGSPPDEGMPIAASAGELVLFSAAHLHATRAHDSGRTRFSIDVRVVHLGDHAAGLGAPDEDNRSRGSTLEDYEVPR